MVIKQCHCWEVAKHERSIRTACGWSKLLVTGHSFWSWLAGHCSLVAGHWSLILPKGGINLYIELEKQAQSDSCKKHKSVSREMYPFLRVKVRRLRRKMYEDKSYYMYICDKNLPTVY